LERSSWNIFSGYISLQKGGMMKQSNVNVNVIVRFDVSFWDVLKLKLSGVDVVRKVLERKT